MKNLKLMNSFGNNIKYHNKPFTKYNKSQPTTTEVGFLFYLLFLLNLQLETPFYNIGADIGCFILVGISK